MGDSSEFRSTLDDSAAVQLTGKIMVGAIIVLFLVVVFVLFLHLYAKWFWSRGQEGTLPSRNDILLRRRRRRSRFVFAQDPALAALRRGLDPSVLRSIPVLIFRSQDFKDGLECAVCLSDVSEGEKARLIPKCNHGFHVECIDMWFQSHSTCPLCRNPVESPEEDHNSGVGGSPNFPTNVLFWGNETQVSTGGEGPSSTTSSSRPTADGMLVIDIPNKQVMSENFAEEEAKSPMTTRLRSLKRLLSGDKRLLPCTPSSVDADHHQVVAVRGQTSKSTLDVV